MRLNFSRGRDAITCPTKKRTSSEINDDDEKEKSFCLFAGCMRRAGARPDYSTSAKRTPQKVVRPCDENLLLVEPEVTNQPGAG